MSPYHLALLVTLAVEAPIVALLYPGRRARLALAAALSTTATHAFMHFALPRLVGSHLAWLLWGEGIALVAEAIVYALADRTAGPGRAVVASALANAASYGVGLLVL